MILLFFCGSILILDIVMECKFFVMRVLMGSRWKKFECKKFFLFNKFRKVVYYGNSKDDGSIRFKNVNGIVWLFLDVSDYGIYEEEEFEDLNLLEIVDLYSFFSFIYDV